MADIALLVRSSVSVILVVAGIGKLGAWRSSRSFDRGLGFSELILGIWLASQLATIVPASLIVAMFLTYALHSIRTGPADRCRCFGAFFPTSGRSMQRMRNLVFLGLAMLNFGFIAISGRADSSWPRLCTCTSRIRRKRLTGTRRPSSRACALLYARDAAKAECGSIAADITPTLDPANNFRSWRRFTSAPIRSDSLVKIHDRDTLR